MNFHLLRLARPPSSHLLFRLRTTHIRGLSSETAQSTKPARSILINNVETFPKLCQILDVNQVGPIESINYEPKHTRAFIKFLDIETAKKFFQRVERSKSIEAQYHIGRRHQSLVEVVAAIGYRFASRRVLINELPEGATLKFLQEDMSRFGDVEAVGYKSMRNLKAQALEGAPYQGPKRGWVQFCSIKSAMMAVKTLRMEQGKGGPVGISYDIENCDWPLRKRYQELFKLKRQKLENPEHFRAVRLTKFGESMSISQTVMPLLQMTKLPSRGEAVLNVKRGLTPYTQSPELTVEFLHPTDALLFWNTCNEEGRRRGKGKATLKALEPDQVIFHNARAIALGATRTIGIYNIKNWEGLTQETIQRHFTTFGPIYRTQVNQKGNCAFVKYCNLDSAMAAIDRIWLRDCTFFEQYDGTMINFASDTTLGNSRVDLTPLYIKGVPNWTQKWELS